MRYSLRKRQHLFQTHGAAILQAHIPTVSNSLSAFINTTVHDFVAAKHSTISAEPRNTHLHSICQAVCASEAINESDFLANLLRPDPPPRQEQSSDSEDDESSDNEDLKPGDPRPGDLSNVQHRLAVAAAAFGDLE